MLTIHPNVLERDGKKAFVVLPYEEFVMIEEELQEYEDLKNCACKSGGSRRICCLASGCKEGTWVVVKRTRM